MLSRRRFLQLVASSIVALAARPKEVFASTGNIDGEQIQFTSEIAQELADKYIKGLLGYSYTPSDPIPFVDVDGSPLGYIVPVVTSNRAAGYLVLDASDDEILTGYRFGDGLVSPMDRGGDLGVESYSFNNPVVMIIRIRRAIFGRFNNNKLRKNNPGCFHRRTACRFIE